MLNINAQINFFALHKLIAITIEFHNVPLCQKSLNTYHYMVLTVIDYKDILFHNDCLRWTSTHKLFVPLYMVLTAIDYNDILFHNDCLC